MSEPQSRTWNPGQPLQLQTERFLIRSLTVQDATDTYIAWWNDAEVQHDLNMPPRNWGVPQAQKHIGRFDNRFSFHLGIFPLGQPLPIGFFTITANPQSKVAVTNVVIGNKQWWGQKVPLEVRTRLLPFIFNRLGMLKVKGTIHGRNLPSIFNYEALGFKCEGILRSELPGIDGGRADIYVYGLLREEWQERNNHA
jgi:ribosomal-protein-alanine N-acetyltransferase